MRLTPPKCASGLSPYDRPANLKSVRLVVEDRHERSRSSYLRLGNRLNC